MLTKFQKIHPKTPCQIIQNPQFMQSKTPFSMTKNYPWNVNNKGMIRKQSNYQRIILLRHTLWLATHEWRTKVNGSLFLFVLLNCCLSGFSGTWKRLVILRFCCWSSEETNCLSLICTGCVEIMRYLLNLLSLNFKLYRMNCIPLGRARVVL
jgi:hypothetical protein